MSEGTFTGDCAKYTVKVDKKVVPLVVKFLRADETVQPPCRKTEGSACFDLTSNEEKIVLEPGELRLIHTGLKLEIPPTHFGKIYERSGFALHGIEIKAGVIDSDYRGEVGVVMKNNSDKQVAISKGMRIAQITFLRVDPIILVEVERLDDTDRGEGGFGSTGTE